MKLKLLLFLVVVCVFCGCGHNRYLEYKSTGVSFSIPFGDLGSLSVCVGSQESSTAMVRGGSSITTESASGAGLLAAAGGASRITTIKFNEQLNEGNIVKVMTSPDVPKEAKIELAKAYSAATKAPEFQPSALQTREATLYSNGFTNQLDSPFQTTGVDKVIEEVADTTEHVADDVATGAGHTANAIIDTTHQIISNVDSTTKKVIDKADVAGNISNNIGDKIKDAVIDGTANLSKTIATVLAILIILVLFVIIMFSGNKKKTSKSFKQKPLNASAPEPDNIPIVDDDGDPSIDLGDVPTQEFVQYPEKKWCVRFFEGLVAFLKSIFRFWGRLSPEDKAVVIDTAKDILKKKKKKEEPPQTEE